MKLIQIVLLITPLLLLPGCCSRKYDRASPNDAQGFRFEFPVKHLSLAEARSVASVALKLDLEINEATLNGRRTFVINSDSRKSIERCVAVLSDLDVGDVDTWTWLNIPDHLSPSEVANHFESNSLLPEQIKLIPDTRTHRILIEGRNRERINQVVRTLTTWLNSQKP